eukprot:m51a1_g3781 putative pre-mrna-processing factor 6 (965) ;mRNA; r:158147-161220
MYMAGTGRKDFMAAQPPPGYVAGMGRGALGFTTRSDIGPARDATDVPTIDQLPPGARGKPAESAAVAAAAAAHVAAAAAGMPPPSLRPAGAPGAQAAERQTSKAAAADDDKEDYSESNYDQFSGYGGSLFDSSTPYDQEDREADDIYEGVDDRMDSRRKKRREQLEKEQLESTSGRPKIQQLFSDLMPELGKLSEDDWASIPEATDQVRPRKRRAVNDQFQRYVPVPDRIIAEAHAESTSARTYDGSATPLDGAATPAMPGTATDLTEIGNTRNKLLQIKLSGASTAVAGQTVVDPKGYLTDLGALKGVDNSQIGDVKKARLLLKSVRTTNPHHAPGWIAGARLEEYAGLIVQARKIALQGTQMCKDSEDMWIEAARLHPRDAARSILAEAVTHLPKSVKIWMTASDLEESPDSKKRVLRKALEFIPNSVKIWKAAVQDEPPENAVIMLRRAVECVPQSVDMWLALAKLETHEEARKVLNKAREVIPNDPAIWITAAKLEEAHGNQQIVRSIIKRAVKSLRQHNVDLSHEQWLTESQNAEKSDAPETCQALVCETMGIGVEDNERKKQWKEDAELSLSVGCVVTARALYVQALIVFPGKKSLWLGLAQLEKQHGTREALDGVLQKAVSYCPQAEVLWLMRAKEQWVGGDVQGARGILAEAFRAISDSEAIWLAAVKLESENNESQRARALLERAREACPTERVWRRSAQLERELKNHDAERSILENALQKFPKSVKLWLMRGSLASIHEGYSNARAVYMRAIDTVTGDPRVWIEAAHCEEAQGTPAAQGRARALIEKARSTIPKTPALWLEAIRIEMRAGNVKVAQNLMAKSLQECPKSGILWAELIEHETGPAKKTRAQDALKQCENDANVLLAVARFVFLADRKLDKVPKWLNNAVAAEPGLGDAWALLYKLETSPQGREEIAKRCAAADPRLGEKWRSVSKAPENKRLTTAEILPKVAALF